MINSPKSACLWAAWVILFVHNRLSVLAFLSTSFVVFYPSVSCERSQYAKCSFSLLHTVCSLSLCALSENRQPIPSTQLSPLFWNNTFEIINCTCTECRWLSDQLTSVCCVLVKAREIVVVRIHHHWLFSIAIIETNAYHQDGTTHNNMGFIECCIISAGLACLLKQLHSMLMVVVPVPPVERLCAWLHSLTH